MKYIPAPLENYQDESCHDSNHSTSLPGYFCWNPYTHTTLSHLNQSLFDPLSPNAFHSCPWSANNPTYSTSWNSSSTSSFNWNLVISWEQSIPGRLPYTSYFCIQSHVAVSGSSSLSHWHAHSIALSLSYKSTNCEACHLAISPCSWLITFLCTPTPFIIFNNTNIHIEDLTDTPGLKFLTSLFCDVILLYSVFSRANHDWILSLPKII